MGATFTDIVKEQRSQGAGVFSSLGKAAGQRTLERIDPRNYLFSRKGLVSALFPGAKGYQAKASKENTTLSDSSSSLSSAQSDSITSKLDELKAVQQITSKNTLVLPLMARDMNVMRQNIIKLVKLSGGKATNRADAFFMTAKQREEAYESKFGKKSPTPLADGKKKEGNFLSDLVSGFLKAGLLIAAVAGLAKLFMDPEFRKKVGQMLNSFGEALFGKEYWNDLKLKISKGFQEIVEKVKDFAIKVLEIYAGLKIAGVLLNRQLMRLTMAGILPTATRAAVTASEAGALAGGTAAAAAAKSAKGATVGRDAKTGKFTKLEKKAPTKWTRFLKFLEKKAPKLFARVGAKLTAIEIGAFVPGPGWVLDLILLGLLVADAWEVYQYYKEFTGQEKKTNPTPVDNKEDLNLNGAENNTGSEYSLNGSSTKKSLPTSPTNMNTDRDSMAQLIRSKFKEAGFSDVQAEAAVANAIAESGLNPNAYVNNGKEESVGLFQMNRNGGLGVGHTVEDLKDPNYNIDLAIKAAKGSSAFMAANSIDDAVSAFVSDVERPANKDLEIKKRTDIALGQNPNLDRTTPSTTSLASAMPNMNDIGKFLDQGSVEFENMIRDYMKTSGDTIINSDSSTKVSSSSSNKNGIPGSTFDVDFVPKLLSTRMA
jgi:hypothetical protein